MAPKEKGGGGGCWWRYTGKHGAFGVGDQRVPPSTLNSSQEVQPSASGVWGDLWGQPGSKKQVVHLV